MTSRPDLRLAPIALGTWLGTFAAVHLHARRVFIAAGLAAIVAATVLLWPRRTGIAGPKPRHFGPGVPPRRTAWWDGAPLLHRADPETGRAAGDDGAEPGGAGWRAILATALLGLVMGTAATAPRVAGRDDPLLVSLSGSRSAVTVEVTLGDDPRRSRAHLTTWVVPATLHTITVGADRHHPTARVLLLADNPQWGGLLPGQRVRAMGRISPARGGDLRAAVISVTTRPELLGSAPWIQRAAGSLRAGLRRACADLDPRPGGLLPGLVVGDVSTLVPEVREDFVATGMSHLTAVSGSNVAIIVGALLLLTRWTRAGPVPTALICAAGVAGFVVLARPSPSVLRAAVMGGLALLALAGGARRAALPGLCATIVVLLLADPELAVDAGFALSVSATAGLLLLAPRWRDALTRRGWPISLAEAVCVPAAAQVACGPVVAAISASVSVVAVPANLLATFAIAPATVLGVASAALSPIWSGGSAFAAWLGSWPCWWLVLVARGGAAIPGGAVPWPGGAFGASLLAIVTLLALLGLRNRAIRRLTLVITMAAVVGALPVRVLAPGWPPAGLLVAACDVGQGDAIVVQVGSDEAILVDTGPDRAAVDRCLDDLGISSIPLLVITHFHADHTGGLAGAFAGRRVAAVLTTAWPEPAAGRDAVHAAASGVGARVETADVGAVLRIGAAELRVVGPLDPLRGTRSDANNNSVVLLVTVRGTRILLTGDAEVEEQRALVGRIGRVDVLKAAHHGSAFQSEALLDELNPRVALISVGAGNKYGHPNAALVARIVRGGARVLRTDLSGDVAVVHRSPDGALGVVTRRGDASYGGAPQAGAPAAATSRVAQATRTGGPYARPEPRSRRRRWPYCRATMAG